MTTNPEAGMRLDVKMEPFERYPALASWIAKMAASYTGLSLGEWMTFVGALNAALVTAEAAAPVAPAGSDGERERIARIIRGHCTIMPRPFDNEIEDSADRAATAILAARAQPPVGEVVGWRRRRDENQRWTLMDDAQNAEEYRQLGYEVRALVDAHPTEPAARDGGDADPVERWGILNHIGTLWTEENFKTKDKAPAYIRDWQKANSGIDLSGHKVVPVEVTMRLSALAASGEK